MTAFAPALPISVAKPKGRRETSTRSAIETSLRFNSRTELHSDHHRVGNWFVAIWLGLGGDVRYQMVSTGVDWCSGFGREPGGLLGLVPLDVILRSGERIRPSRVSSEGEVDNALTACSWNFH